MKLRIRISVLLLISGLIFTMSSSFSQNMQHGETLFGIVFPFSIAIDPMEKLLLVNFENDPDSLYVGFEPQVFDDTINGIGHLVIGWRTDKKIDVYHQKTLKLDSAKYSIAGAGLNKMIPVDMDEAFFEVNDFGVQAHYKFRDLQQREVEIRINENNPKKRKPFGLLAPMGDAASNPSSMPMVLLHDFYFVRDKKTDVIVSVNGTSRAPDMLPTRMDGQRMTFIRYSPKPLIATLNPDFNDVLEGLDVEAQQEILVKGDSRYEIVWNEQKASVKSFSVSNAIHPITMRFSPAFPCLNAIPKNAQYKGKFVISGHASVGRIAGVYSIEAGEEFLHLSMVPTKGWKPKTSKLSTWMMYTVAKVFKKWPTTYRWDARLHTCSEALWYMYSKWTRTGKIIKD